LLFFILNAAVQKLEISTIDFLALDEEELFQKQEEEQSKNSKNYFSS
jgi:hypothetical protein